MKILTKIWKTTFGRWFGSDTTNAREPSQWLIDWLEGGPTDAGVRVTAKTALALAPFWQGVNTIAGDVATLPLILHRREGENKHRWREHRAFRLLRRQANEFMSATTFKETLQGHCLTWGNGYAEIERNYRSEPIALWPLLPNRTKPVIIDGRLWYVTMTMEGEPRRIRAENMFHVKGLGFDGIVGYSVISKARQNLGLTMAQEKYAARFFGNGATPGGVLEHPGQLDDDAVERMRRTWNDMHEGLERTHRIAILEEGTKFSPIAMPMKDAQWLEGRQFGRTDVASWLTLPPHKVGDLSRATFTNIEEQNRDYLNTSLMRWLVKWQDEADEKLLTDRQKDNEEGYFEFLTAALLRGDVLRRYQAYGLAIANRIMNPNECRAMENLNPYDGGDEYVNPHINPDADEQAGEIGKQDERQRAALARFTDLCDVECRRVCHAARTASNFTGWVASFYDRWVSTVREVIAEFGGDEAFAEAHCSESRDQIMKLLDHVKQAELANEIQALTDAWAFRAKRLAAAVCDSIPIT